MAKRMKSKIQPAVMRMTFSETVDADEDKRFYIDLSQCASLLNRRFYRQGLNWAVAGFKFVARNTSGTNPIFARIGVHSLPHTWIMSNSWEKGFRAWQKMIKNAVDDTEQQSVKGKFLDFKIYMNDKHHELGFKQNMKPIDSLGNSAIRGEWLPATLEMPVTRDILTLPAQIGETAEYQIIATGDNYPGAGGDTGQDAVSLIQGYANSRALPGVVDPNVPTDNADASGVTPENWLAALFNEGLNQDSGVLEDVAEFDLPPYPFEDTQGMIADTTKYPGGATQLPGLEIVDEAIITQGTVGFPINTVLQGGTFPCGLIELRVNNFSTGKDSANIDFDLYVDLVPGNHRGYLCESMTEM